MTKLLIIWLVNWKIYGIILHIPKELWLSVNDLENGLFRADILFLFNVLSSAIEIHVDLLFYKEHSLWVILATEGRERPLNCYIKSIGVGKVLADFSVEIKTWWGIFPPKSIGLKRLAIQCSVRFNCLNFVSEYMTLTSRSQRTTLKILREDFVHVLRVIRQNNSRLTWLEPSLKNLLFSWILSHTSV